MAAGDAQSTMEQSINAGWSGNSAIALVESASLAHSRSWRGRLVQLPRFAQELGKGPALLVAGAALGPQAIAAPPVSTRIDGSAAEAVNDV